MITEIAKAIRIVCLIPVYFMAACIGLMLATTILSSIVMAITD